MEWCLDCHRAAGEVPAPEVARSSTWPGSRPSNQLELGRKLAARVRRQDQHRLLHVPPMSHEHAPGRARRASRASAVAGAAAQPRATGGASRSSRDAPGVPRVPAPRVPRAGLDVRGRPEGRREFLKLMGASLALAGLTGVHQAAGGEDRALRAAAGAARARAGRSSSRRRACHGGYARGRAGREPQGPADQGRGQPRPPGEPRRTDVFGQAAVLGLYDPDRSQAVLYLGQMRTWGEFRAALREPLAKRRAKGGAGLRILTGRSHARRRSRRRCRSSSSRLPAARWHEWEPVGSRQRARGRACWRSASPSSRQYRFDQADVVLSLDADFLAGAPGEPAARARVRGAPARPDAATLATMNRALRRRELADAERRVRRPPPRAPQLRGRGLRARAGRRAAGSRSRAAAAHAVGGARRRRT